MVREHLRVLLCSVRCRARRTSGRMLSKNDAAMRCCLQAHKDAELRRKEGLAMSSELLQELMREPAAAPFIHGLACCCRALLHVVPSCMSGVC